MHDRKLFDAPSLADGEPGTQVPGTASPSKPSRRVARRFKSALVRVNPGFGWRTKSFQGDQLNKRTSVSPTRFGLAFPLESFITCPFRKLIAAAFPAL